MPLQPHESSSLALQPLRKEMRVEPGENQSQHRAGVSGNRETSGITVPFSAVSPFPNPCRCLNEGEMIRTVKSVRPEKPGPDRTIDLLRQENASNDPARVAHRELSCERIEHLQQATKESCHHRPESSPFPGRHRHLTYRKVHVANGAGL
ncbi:glycosyltransferases probably involved in cell wall biogenesis [Anopheles sinensis]|uniref:Glycosyltransferases probably involved in cell wall biogenesis n=1 Tax=Anopheles sinensis TaxID=74873 RepID=A0A084VXH0_ANOSI|nr:glycosyltransferases probably involved in cell wall biogenesis [Anopheles sinensis]